MASEVQDMVRDIAHALQGATEHANPARKKGNSNGGLSGAKGLAAGAGAAALAPLAFKAAGRLGGGSLGDVVKSPGDALSGAASKLGDRVTSGVKDRAQEALDGAGGPGGIAKDALKSMLPFGGGSGGDGGGGKGGAQGTGKGRRMPVQQSVDIGLPIETVYNQWTQFEQWPEFMHRVKRVTQEDPCTVSFAVKIWGKTKEFTAKIETQRPDERVKWKVSQGMTHTGVVSFHELGPNLTRVLLGFDLDPGGVLEKFARGARHVKRAARGDLHRFKAFIEMAEQETGAWRGVIEDGEVVEDHDPSYDEDREYSDIEELTGESEEDSEDDSEDDSDEESADESEEEDEEEEKPRTRTRRQPARSSSSRSPRSSGSSSRPSGGGRSPRARSQSGGSSSRGRARSESHSR